MSNRTFLQLPPELGGVRFGPFLAEIRIGSDKARNQIVIDPSHGVFPVHAVIQPQPDGSYALAPATPECKVFVMPAGQTNVWPVTSAIRANTGDLVIVGTPHGPRFQLQQDGPRKPPPTAQQIAQNTMAQGERGFLHGIGAKIDGLTQPTASKGGIAAEVRRRSVASVLSTPGPLRNAYHIWSRVRTGAFNNPVYIVGIVIALISLVGTGGVLSCSGIFYTFAHTLGLDL